MLNIEDFECIKNIASSIKEIHFNEIPSHSILEALSEGCNDILLHLPLDKACILEYSEYSFGANIVSINIETDAFIDSNNLYNFPNLRKLVLSCSNSNIQTLSPDDLDDMKMAIENLEYVDQIIFDLHKIQQTAIDEVKNFIFFPHKKIDIRFIDHKPRKTKNSLKRYL